MMKLEHIHVCQKSSYIFAKFSKALNV